MWASVTWKRAALLARLCLEMELGMGSTDGLSAKLQMVAHGPS